MADATRAEDYGVFIAVCVSLVRRRRALGALGRLRLCGRSEAVDAFEPLDPGTKDPGPYLDAYSLMEQGHRGAADAFAALARARPDDPLARLHHARLAGGERGVELDLSGV